MLMTNYSYRRVFSFYKRFLWPHKIKFITSLILTAFSAASGLFNAYAVAEIVNTLISYTSGEIESLDRLYFILIAWAVIIFLGNSFGFFAKYLGVNAAEHAEIESATEAVRHLSKLDVAWHEKENAGNKMKRIQRGSHTMVDMTRLLLNTLIEVVINFIGAVIILARFDIRLAGFVIVYQIIYYFIASYTRARGTKAHALVNQKEEDITGLFYEIISNIRSVKVLGMTNRIFEYVSVKTVDMLKTVRERIFWFQFGGLARSTWEIIARVSLIAFVAWGIVEGRYEVGFLVLFYGYFNTLTSSANQLSNVAQEMASAKVSVIGIMKIFDEPVIIDLEDNKKDFPDSWNHINLKNLSFKYADNAVLSEINLSISKSEKVGIVGLSGAGKSTLFKLLLKEHENYDGEIDIENTPLKTIKKSSYINHIAAVLQDTEVFNMSLKDNIVLANSKEAENAELFDRALDIAHIKDFLPKLPQGVDTIIGEKGVKLSGGEKQRLGIARAVFKQPEILFLDEATSHLDVESEKKIQDSLKKFFKDVTAIVIAHRLSTIKEMDRIIVIEGGKIIETGTFDELHAQSGRFREFWDKQKI